MRYGTDIFTVIVACYHHIQRVTRGAVKHREVIQIANCLRNDYLQVEFSRKFCENSRIAVFIKKQEHIALIKKGMRIRKTLPDFFFQMTRPEILTVISGQIDQGKSEWVKVRKIGACGLKSEIRGRREPAFQ